MLDFAKVLFYYGYITETPNSKTKIVCPFHDDLKPSMLVDLDTHTYYCFGCTVKGNAIEFICQKEKCDALKAYMIYNDIIESKGRSNIKINQISVLTNKEAIEDAKLYFYTLPKTNWLKDEIQNDYLLKRGFKESTLNRLDIRENFNHVYGVIAPMLDMNRFRGYVCRATVESDRKYLYNKGFSRRNTLVGNYNKKWVMITEGFLDYAKLIQFHQTNSCAILGWKITDNQISKIQKYTDCVISALDNTDTGEQGTKYLKQYFNVIRFQFPSHKKDIGDLDVYDWNLAMKKTEKLINKFEMKAGS